MGVRLFRRDVHGDGADWVVNVPGLASGQWHRIARYNGDPYEYFQHQMAGEFTLSDGDSVRNDFVRFRASVTYGDPPASLLLEEYTCWNRPTLTGVRIQDGPSNLLAVDVLAATTTSAPSATRLRIRHEEFWPGGRWRAVDFQPVAEAPDGELTVVRRGIGPTGAFHDLGAQYDVIFRNGWVDYGGLYAPAGYRMRPGNIVELRGLVKDGTVGFGTPICQLPAGHRPAHRRIFTTIGAGALARVDVLPTGDVAAIFGANGYLSLDGVNFLAEL